MVGRARPPLQGGRHDQAQRSAGERHGSSVMKQHLPEAGAAADELRGQQEDGPGDEGETEEHNWLASLNLEQ